MSVIGAGYWGKKVIREIMNVSRTTGRVNLCSVVDNSPSMLEQCMKEFGPLDYRLSYQGLLSDSALQSREADELVRLAEAKRRVLAVGHVHRFNNGLNELRRIVQSGMLGDIYYLRLQWTGYLPPQKDRDVITDLGPHPFDICNNILGTWPTKISCRGKGYRGGAGEEVAFITAEHIDGVNANIELSWLDSEKHRDVTVVGSDAVARLDCLDQNLVLQRSDKTETISTVPSNTLEEEIIHFAGCIESNSASEPYSNLSDGGIGAGVVRLLEASRRSLLEERSVQVRVPAYEELVAGEPAPTGFRKLTS